MSADDGFIEAGSGSGTTWKPETEGDKITGIYLRKKENVGKNDSNVYLIEEEGNEDPTSVWGSTVLDTKFEEIPETSMVRITYLGFVKGQRASYKDFKVEYKKPEVA